MEEVFSPSHSANATAITVEYLLSVSIIVKKFTNRTEILGKLNFAALALITYRLNETTVQTFYFLNGVSVKFVVLFGVHFLFVLNFVVA